MKQNFQEGDIFYSGDYSWQIDTLVGFSPTRVQSLLFRGETLAGRWLFKASASLEQIKKFMDEKIKEAETVKLKRFKGVKENYGESREN